VSQAETPPFDRLLVANRGEIALRIIAAASDLGIATVSVAPADDAGALHTLRADKHIRLSGEGPLAYLDVGQLARVAARNGCDAVHPGYGFASETSAFREACVEHSLTFVGPSSESLDLLGNKSSAVALARQAGGAVLPGRLIGEVEDLAEALRSATGPVMLKAVLGGGGRGMRVVEPGTDLAAAIDRCRSEAAAAFGNGDLYAEKLIRPARHIEVQILGDGTGAVVVLGERECSLQRRRQKLIEFAPAFGVSESVLTEVRSVSSTMASSLRYLGLGTFEFLVDSDGRAFFMEANPRLQVEHTVTEAVTGLDLVELQLRVAAGEMLVDLGLAQKVPSPSGFAVQARINTEHVNADGSTSPTGGLLAVFEPATGRGVRVDSHARAGTTPNPRYDSLLAKVIVTGRDRSVALRRLRRALAEMTVGGVDTNIDFLRALLADSGVEEGAIDTEFVERTAPALDFAVVPGPTDSGPVVGAPMQGTVVEVYVSVGDEVVAGTQVAVMEAMKMEHVLDAPFSGVVTAVLVAPGETVNRGDELIVLRRSEVTTPKIAEHQAPDPDQIRPDLAEAIDRHQVGLDHRRPDAVASRHVKGRRTARENVDDLIDEGSMVEYGALVIAPQRRRRSLDELIAKTPGDGMVCGIATVNKESFGNDSRCAIMSYDYTVLAGTQGGQNHRKKDRLFELADRWRLPVIVFAEGGGGRPGDTDGVAIAGLDCLAFALFGALSGRVPLVGINTGYCFAGNAALLGMCDVIIATVDSNVGMGGPAMIEGGGLGTYHPTEVGPAQEQFEIGVIDILVADDEEAVAAAKRYVSYFQGHTSGWEAPDQRLLRNVVPENRLRVYEIRDVIALIADVDSVLELRAGWGSGMVTALARIEGRPVGIIANNPMHLAGAIDSDAADKASRFMQLCDGFAIPIVFLCDTPGIMVGPEAERSGTVRHAARMFVTGAGIQVPFCTVVTRKGYGLGAQAMAGGSFKSPYFTVSWPTGEFGGMGLEGAVQLGYRRELEAIKDPEERQAAYRKRVDRMYEVGKALNFASAFEIDDVIDPADTRRWIAEAFATTQTAAGQLRTQRPNIDTW